MSVLFILIFCFDAKAQFPPPAGQPGSTAIHADSSCFVGWAVTCTVQRGYVNISDTTAIAGSSNRASYGSSTDACGKADNIVVSLGDKGIAVLTFEFPIVNGPGWDFAVFENALNDTFLELAFVEVSSNGTDFFRFPSVSLTQTNTQTASFGGTEAEKIHNLAGKYRGMFGVPFDLDELTDNLLLDKNNITHVRVMDVGGSINPLYGSTDFAGTIINDPFPTPFESCGFDLDAVGVIHNTQTNIGSFQPAAIRVYPNPASDVVCIEGFNGELTEITCTSMFGTVMNLPKETSQCFNLSMLPSGIYLLECRDINNSKTTLKFLKL